MKAVILAGGFGTRLSEETSIVPKPLVKLGGKPILWHIMKILYTQGIKEFIICCGYKSLEIKKYFINYALENLDVMIDGQNYELLKNDAYREDWKVLCAETGLNTMTGGRIKMIRPYIQPNENFILTYGDGLADINIQKLLKQHVDGERLATVTAVQPPGRFGNLSINGDYVEKFQEKPIGDGGWISGGFFVLNEKCIDYIESNDTTWEDGPLRALSEHKQLTVYKHSSFWHPMDTLRDKNKLQGMIDSQEGAPWISW